MHSVESRFVIGPSDILSAGVYVCTFQPANFTGFGSEGLLLLLFWGVVLLLLLLFVCFLFCFSFNLMQPCLLLFRMCQEVLYVLGVSVPDGRFLREVKRAQGGVDGDHIRACVCVCVCVLAFVRA